MNRFNERFSRRWSTPGGFRDERSSTEESSTLDTADSPRVKNTSTPLGPRDPPDLKEINRSRRGPRKIEQVFSDDSQRLQRRRSGRKSRDKVDKGSGRQRDRQKKRKHRDDSEEQKDESESLTENRSDNNVKPKRYKRNRDIRDERTNELPITEILKRSQENARTKYEDQSPLPVLVTDKVYVQHKGGFSAVKMNRSRGERKCGAEESVDENQTAPPIRLAIMIQRFWKNTGFFYQGLLAGMALLHCAMLHILFDASTEFVVKYSTFCEVYANVFSFLIAVCIVSTFDKFDLARFDVDHLRELYFEYNRAVIAIPLYLVAFCLHLICARTDTRLALIQYRNNTSAENTTDVLSLVDDLSSWQKVTTSKDLLVTFAWVFVSLGTKDDSFLVYLQSMEKYANDIDSSRQ